MPHKKESDTWLEKSPPGEVMTGEREKPGHWRINRKIRPQHEKKIHFFCERNWQKHIYLNLGFSRGQVRLLWSKELTAERQKRLALYLAIDKEKKDPQEMRNLAVYKTEGSRCHLETTKLMIFYVSYWINILINLW